MLACRFSACVSILSIYSRIASARVRPILASIRTALTRQRNKRHYPAFHGGAELGVRHSNRCDAIVSRLPVQLQALLLSDRWANHRVASHCDGCRTRRHNYHVLCSARPLLQPSVCFLVFYAPICSRHGLPVDSQISSKASPETRFGC